MGRFPVFLVMLLACVALASVCYADSVEYTIYRFPVAFSDCTFSAGPGTYTVIATLNLSTPAKALQFSNYTECNGNTQWNYPVSGDPQTVLTVDFGGCVSGPVPLFSAQVDVDYGCCPALMQGPRSGGTQVSPPVLIGCDDVPRFLIPPCSAPAPSPLAPPDGQTGVSLTPDLSWGYNYGGDYCSNVPIPGVAVFTILYGVDPAHLNNSIFTLESTEWTLPMLEPNTEYFWRVNVWNEVSWYTGSAINQSETRSFTTGYTVPVEHTTWGVVKSLYK